MAGPFEYPSPYPYPATVTNRWGRVDTTLVNDGQTFTLTLRGNRFAGPSPDSLELVGTPAETDTPPTLRLGDLCACTIEWRMPIGVSLPGTGPTTLPLTVQLVLGDPKPNNAIDAFGATLTLHLPTGGVETTRFDDMERALLDLQRQLPDGTRLLACITCAFSDYFPAGTGFIGAMACFRDHKDAYRTVNSKQGIFDLWDKRSGFVQETFHCPDFEQRRPGAGYRG